MAESPPTQSTTNHPATNDSSKATHEDFPLPRLPQIPIEIISEEEMALLESAIAAASRSSLSFSSPTPFQRNARSIRSISLLSKRGFSSDDIEDIGGGEVNKNVINKKNRASESLFNRFRRKRGLSVTDLTSTEWCEKQMEFFLRFGKPRSNKAMKAGSARHAVLEKEVVKSVEVRVLSVEDVWALKFLNFILGVNQLLLDGLTRELPLVGLVEGVWTVGVIDEIRMAVTEGQGERNPTLVDTKTRAQASLPSEPQRRNGRLQLMCYKYLWDKLAVNKFPTRQLFEFFSLNPHQILSEEIRENTANSGFPAETLNDLARYFRSTCCLLPTSHDQLLLRYEFQEDQSVLGEDEFTYDPEWVKGQIRCSLEFWHGEREASYTPKEERWKCRFCSFASVCPVNTCPDSSPS